MISVAVSIQTGHQWKVRISTDNEHINTNARVFRCVQKKDLTIIIWGDPAQHEIDDEIIANLGRGYFKSYWGRSWIAINHRLKSVVAATDQVGTFPVLSYQVGQHHILASGRKALVDQSAMPVSLNPEAMRELLAFGQILDSKSILNHTEHHSGRSIIKILEDDTKTVESDHNKPMFGGWSTNMNDALDAFVEAVRKVVKHNPNVLVSLSGGLDSRLILSAVLAVGGKPTAITYGDPNSTDVTIAKQIAQSLNIPLFSGSALTSQSHWETYQRVANIGCGESPIHHAHSIIDPNLLQQTQHKTLMTGTGAETYRAFYYDRGMPGYSVLNSKYFKDKLLGKAHQYIREEFSRTAEQFYAVAPEYRQELSEVLDHSINEHSHPNLTAAEFLDNYYLKVRMARMVVAGQQLLDPFYHRSHPFLDKDVVFYAGNLPLKYKLGSTFHRKAIARLSPKLSSFKWDKTDLPLAKGLPMAARYPGLSQRLGLKAQWGKVSQPMFSYTQWLSQLPPHAVKNMLDYAGVNPLSAQTQTNELTGSTNNQHMLGLSAVWACLLSHRTTRSVENISEPAL